VNNNQVFALILIIIGCIFGLFSNHLSEKAQSIPLLLIGGSLTYLKGQENHDKNND